MLCSEMRSMVTGFGLALRMVMSKFTSIEPLSAFGNDIGAAVWAIFRSYASVELYVASPVTNAASMPESREAHPRVRRETRTRTESGRGVMGPPLLVLSAHLSAQCRVLSAQSKPNWPGPLSTEHSALSTTLTTNSPVPWMRRAMTSREDAGRRALDVS